MHAEIAVDWFIGSDVLFGDGIDGRGLRRAWTFNAHEARQSI